MVSDLKSDQVMTSSKQGPNLQLMGNPAVVNMWVTGFGKEEEGTFKNLGLVVAQCNGIATCAYSLKIFTVHKLLYLTVHGLTNDTLAPK